jgi:uroporphyrinogen decarboxylase
MDTHRTRLEACLSGGVPDRLPVALWRHFPVDDQDPANLAAATIAFQQTFDFDLIKVTPSSSFCLRDWGAEDRWRGAAEGTREYTKRVVTSPDDWQSLPVPDPNAGSLGAQIICLEELVRGCGGEVPIIQTVFNPLAQAKNLIGGTALLEHMRNEPAALHEGLKTITESSIRFIDSAKRSGIDGIFYAVQHAQDSLLSESEYREFGCAYDLKVLEAADGLWLNMLHLHGDQIMFDLFVDYPVGIINWHDQETYPSLKEGLQRFSGAVCGGLDRREDVVLGTPDHIRQKAMQGIRETGGRRFILGTGCVTPLTAPYGNLMAVRRSIEFD